MSKFHVRTIYILSALLLFVMLGGPQMAQAWTMPQEGQQQSSQAQPASSQGVTEKTGTTEPTRPLPDAPSTQQQPSNAKQQKDKTPLGAAAAEAGATAGGAASRPAGSALAPAKQGQRRSF